MSKDELDKVLKTNNFGIKNPQSMNGSLKGNEMDQGNYRKVLELMLELERKFETRFDEV